MPHRAFPRRVLVVEAGPRLSALLGGDPSLEVQRAEEIGPALEGILSGELDGAVVSATVRAPFDGVGLVERAQARGCVIPLVVVADGVDRELEGRALAAGAAGCVDLRTAGPRELVRALAFAREVRARAESAQARFLHQIGSSLTHEGKNALAAVGGTIQVIADRLAPGSPEREICGEVQARLREFSETLETITLLIQGKDLARGDP